MQLLFIIVLLLHYYCSGVSISRRPQLLGVK